jgi:Mrp family chromosome partitioning ATPase
VNTTQYASIRDYLAVVRQHRWLVLLCVLIVGGGAFAYSQTSDPVYEAETTLACNAPTESVELIGLPPVRDQTAEERAAVCAERANRRSVLEAVRTKERLGESISDLESRINARAEVRTNLVVITAEDGNARRAAAIANALAEEVVTGERRDQQRRYDQLIATTERVYRRSLRGDDPFRRFQRQQFQEQIVRLRTTRDFTRPVEITEAAVPPGSPTSPKIIRSTIFGVVGGLLLGIMLAFLRSALDRRLRGAREIEEESQLPVLAAVRESALGRMNFGDASGEGDAELDLEAFRILNTNLEYMNVDRPPKRILVTSPLPEEGKSTVAASLAVVAGLSGRRVLLIESDLRRPVLAGWAGLDPKPGLVDYLVGRAEPREVVRAVALAPPGAQNGAAGDEAEPHIIAVTVAGEPPPRPAELLRSKRFSDFAATAAQAYDLVIFDSPPLLPVTDALDLIEHADAVVLCARANQTTRDQLRAAMDALQRLPERPTGVVVTGITDNTEGSYGSYGYTQAQSRRR